MVTTRNTAAAIPVAVVIGENDSAVNCSYNRYTATGSRFEALLIAIVCSQIDENIHICRKPVGDTTKVGRLCSYTSNIDGGDRVEFSWLGWHWF